jgi:hypothetical protein
VQCFVLDNGWIIEEIGVGSERDQEEVGKL